MQVTSFGDSGHIQLATIGLGMVIKSWVGHREALLADIRLREAGEGLSTRSMGMAGRRKMDR